jgi:hypothetical protein
MLMVQAYPQYMQGRGGFSSFTTGGGGDGSAFQALQPMAQPGAGSASL